MAGCSCTLARLPPCADRAVEVFADRGYEAPDRDLRGLPVAGLGYRWIRLRRGPVRTGGS